MTTFADDRWEKEANRFKSISYLWKTDDEDWIETRREAWKTAIQDDEDPSVLAYGNFYIFGEEPPRYFIDDAGSKQDILFDLNLRISLTPFENSDDLLRFWELLVERTPDGVSQDHGRFEYIGEILDKFPERDRMVKLVTETMFSPNFFLLYAERKKGSRRTRITIDPRDFVVGYSGLSTFYHDENLHEWDYRNFSIEYFLMSVRFCEENDKLVTPRQLKALPEMYEFLLALDDSKLDCYRLELKKALISAAEAENSPTLLRQALDSGRRSEVLWNFDSGYNKYLQQHRVKPRKKLKKPKLPE